MPPTLILIRHAEALHNVDHDHGIPDPELTARGREQCAELWQNLQQHAKLLEQVEAIVVSPMRRTLETMQLALGPLMKENVKIEPNPDWQENSDDPCDTGTELSEIQDEFQDVDFSDMDPSYPDKTTRCKNGSTNPYAWTRSTLHARAQRALAKLYARPEKVIVVVTHSGFLRLGVSNKQYAHADYRVFDFAPVKPVKASRVEYSLSEWEQTSNRGGGMGRSPKEVWVPRPDDFPPWQVSNMAVAQVSNVA